MYFTLLARDQSISCFALAPRNEARKEGVMNSNLVMLDLMRAFMWFDEQLRARLKDRGWGAVSRSQSLVLTHIANGASRASRIAEFMGVSRQAMSQLLNEMAEAGLIEFAPDPKDRRAQLVRFAPGASKIREDAQQTLRELESEMEAKLGKAQTIGLRAALAKFP
jgi:DNA-binding MarR family transcriptional regulator